MSATNWLSLNGGNTTATARQTSHPDQGISWFSSVPPYKCFYSLLGCTYCAHILSSSLVLYNLSHHKLTIPGNVISEQLSGIKKSSNTLFG